MSAMEIDVQEQLKQLSQKVPQELRDYFLQFQDLYEKKLWHQLTMKVKQFVMLPNAKPFLIPLYQQFLKHWESKMNSSSFVQICIMTAKQFPDAKKSIEFLMPFIEKVKSENEAFVLAKMEIAYFHLLLNQVEQTKEAMEECEQVLNGMIGGIDPVVHASFYRVSADYHKALSEYGKFYKNAFLFLACVPLEEIPKQEQQDRALDLAIAALLSPSIYDFGELLLHPILQNLSQSQQYQWLYQLLLAFNKGDFGQFDAMRGHLSKLKILEDSVGFMRQKLCLMVLMELGFEKRGEGNRLSFDLISKEARLSKDEIEHLIMKALSLGLVRGAIDQLEQVFELEWVQPRVLDKQQVQTMQEQVQKWQQRVEQVAQSLVH